MRNPIATKYRRSKADTLAYDNKYTDEDVAWLKLIDKWRREENFGIWPTVTQYLALAKRFLGLALILIFCSVCFAEGDLNRDCKVDYKDIAQLADGWLARYDFEDFAIVANNWLKQDSDCMMRSYQKQYQELRKKISQVEPHLYHPPAEVIPK